MVIAFGVFAKTLLNQRAKIILIELENYKGCTQYAAIKQISYKHKIAKYTLKFVIHKLILAGIIDYTSGINITKFGSFLIESLRGDSITQHCSQLQTTFLKKASMENGGTGRSGCESRSPHFLRGEENE